jgi:hypothetical protein
MKSILLFASLLLCFSFVSAQTPVNTFPQSWYGDWAGRLDIYNQSGKRMEVGMELKIAPTDSADRWQWTLIYSQDTTRDERQYELVAIDAAKGHYQIDEKNSILLDSYLIGNVLTSRFSVSNSLLLTNYTLHADHLEFEIFVGGKEEARETGKDVEYEIFSYPMGTMQRAMLYRH